ncbi:uncharacterized protein ATNIH1004_010423 [Aspergillus tanneri]|uniref:Uncharacterized protein n=1 Tax=Aspergillus tanneri TaxID=1220188 RepID=A0A5M9MED4_9EURO|nr:uncharacterized protein ATNIH1004_010423 [Aspergillus tanneri]KAA8643654.1 hypothetical protein ATNIH1004_010423 [Aspergillus tanneri]
MSKPYKPWTSSEERYLLKCGMAGMSQESLRSKYRQLLQGHGRRRRIRARRTIPVHLGARQLRQQRRTQYRIDCHSPGARTRPILRHILSKAIGKPKISTD